MAELLAVDVYTMTTVMFACSFNKLDKSNYREKNAVTTSR